jgi:type IX secretion system PorP/SprF family membrane protein
MHNEVTINPAYAGSHDVGSTTALHRNQWVNMAGAPVTYSFNAHTPTPIQGEKVGLGLSVVNDKIGIMHNFTFFGMYSYRLTINQNSNLQLGLQAGFINYKYEFGLLSPKNSGDINFASGTISSFNVNFGTGAYYFTDKFYLGISMPKLINNKATHGGEILAKQARHLFITSGYVLDISPAIKLKPSVLYKYTKAAPMELDITGNLIFNDVLWTGLSWRSFDSIDILLGIQATKQLHIGYAYDFTTTQLTDYHDGSHEILVNYRLNFSSTRVLTPRYY